VCDVLAPTFFSQIKHEWPKNQRQLIFEQLFGISNTGCKFQSSTLLRSLTAWSGAYAARHRDLIRHSADTHAAAFNLTVVVGLAEENRSRQASQKTRRALSRCSRIDRRPWPPPPLLYWVSLVLAVRYLRRRQRLPRSGRRFRGRHRS